MAFKFEILKDMAKIRYFSQLTPRQKDKASNLYLKIKLNILDLPEGLARQIIYDIDLNRIIQIKQSIVSKKMFYYDKLDCYIPLIINELLKIN